MASVKEQLQSVLAWHYPVEEEVEVWADDEDSTRHDEQFPLCAAMVGHRGPTACAGHSLKVEVCSECGYEHDSEQPVFRPWPCPTVREVQAALESAPAVEQTVTTVISAVVVGLLAAIVLTPVLWLVIQLYRWVL